MRFRFPSGGKWVAVAVILVASVVVWLLFAGQDAGPDSAAARNAEPAATGTPAARTGVVLAPRNPGYKPFAPGASPYLLSAGPAERGLDLDQLRRDLAGTGKPVEEEVDRLVKLARFQDRMDVLAEVLPTLSEEERRQESYEILGQLPEHVAHGEILPREALATTTALLEIGEADPAVRDELTRRLTASLQAYVAQAVGPEPTTEPRFQAYAQERDRMVGELKSSVQDPQAQQAAIAQREFEIRRRHY